MSLPLKGFLTLKETSEDLEVLKEYVYSRLSQDLGISSEEELEKELYEVVTEEELEKELYRNAEETPIENLDVVTEEELEKELDTNAEEITTVEEEIVNPKINTSSDIFKDINTDISIPRTNFPIGLESTPISIPTKNYIEKVDMSNYRLNDEDRWDSKMRDIPSLYNSSSWDDNFYSGGYGSGSGGWGFGWSW
ncbi:hypothetical protein AB834_01685 [PVC group bacterium (ex Bugula neritina AB1)]|nr:hypothetical protein AB834_01685 [PVC group bacterium (ex Bugula neritina AB1)]